MGRAREWRERCSSRTPPHVALRWHPSRGCKVLNCKRQVAEPMRGIHLLNAAPTWLLSTTALTKGALLCQMSLDKPRAWISFSAWNPELREWIFHVKFLRGFPRALSDVIVGSTPVGWIGPSPPSLHPNHCVESCYSGEAQERSLSLPSTPPAELEDWPHSFLVPKPQRMCRGWGYDWHWRMHLPLTFPSFFFLFSVPGLELRALHFLDKHSTMELCHTSTVHF